MSSARIRYLLADEVGLGKTIEAGLITRELKLRGLVRRILVVAPKGLVTQWVSEMRLHFNEEFQLILPEDLKTLQRLAPREGVNPWTLFNQVVCPMDSVKPMDKRRGWSREHLAEYNRDRFEDLIAAGWDLVIVDEAHRLGGSTDQVARYKLGQGLAEAAPYLLLLSATPHQGKTDAFYRLVSLLDPLAFPDLASLNQQRVQPYIIRTEKRHAINAQGQPLFKPRQTQLVPVSWSVAHRQHRQLYEAVTDYVREGYNQALKQKKSYVGFLMILMQRLVTSSTRAIRTTLERRLEVLRQPEEQLTLFPTFSEDEWVELDGQEQVEAMLNTRLKALKNEKAEGEQSQNIVFIVRDAEANASTHHLTVEDARIRGLAMRLPRFAAGQPIPCITLPGLPLDVQGCWSLWRIAIYTKDWNQQRIMPLFLHDNGRVFLPTARHIWEQLLTSDVEIGHQLTGEEATQAFEPVWKSAVIQGKTIYDELLQQHCQQLDREREKAEYAFAARRRTIERIGLLQVRDYRLAQLTQEEQTWREQLNQASEVSPELMPLLLIRLLSKAVSCNLSP